MVTFVTNIQADFGTLNLFKYFTAGPYFATSPATDDTNFTVYPDPAVALNKKIIVTGDGFEYSGNGTPYGGTIKTMTFYSTAPNPDRLDYRISGLDLPAYAATDYSNENPIEVANEIFAGADRIIGSRFNDFLSAFGGRDFLNAGAGRDTYYFNAPPGPANADHIGQFVARDDTIGLDHSVFKFIGQDKGLSSVHFKDVANGRVDGNDHILYNSSNGKLFYDQDGRGGVAAKLFGIIDTDPVLNFRDFHVY